ncbi:hypothetical protein JL721_11969 [Aureococcus anophagefferens]|nr:hypothetical protein JL721_11969 [Aureococcus anophagefferens]
MVDQGVSGLDESRPYAIVLNGNYASLAPYYGPVFEKAVKEHAKYNAILYHPAKALKEELSGASCDFEGYYNQFHQAVYEWAHSCFAMVTPEGKLEVFMSEVMQFGRSYGPAVGQSMMDAICEITRQEFDRGDRPVIQAALRAEARQSGRRRGLAAR